ncbi:MAG: transcription antitermination factor NusB [Lachnospiraceae bacterium]|nr:transcription antitermination factor NusB [Lachnospiraceae bacterium]
MSRRAERERVFRLIFRADMFSPEEMEQQIRYFFESEEEDRFEKKLEEAGEDADPASISLPEEDPKIRERISKKALDIVSHIEELDKALDERISGWDTSRIGRVELTVLRLALYEMRYEEDVSDAIAINEAVELARKYGQDKSSEFVNGVLARFAAED